MRNATVTVATALVGADDTVRSTSPPTERAQEPACQMTAGHHTTGASEMPITDTSVRPGCSSLALERLLEEISNQDAESRADRLQERGLQPRAAPRRTGRVIDLP